MDCERCEKGTLLNPSDTTCELRNLEDYTYRIDVRGVGMDGSESLVETIMASLYGST